MIEPELSDDAFLADVAASRDSWEHLRLWWLGQSGFLLQWHGFHLVLDPYLSDSLTAKYAHTDKPHVRMTRRVVDPARLDFVDAVTSSHHHTDHLDGMTLGPMMAASPSLRVVVPAAHLNLAAERLGVAVERLDAIDAGQSLTIGPCQLHAVPAAHESLEQDERSRQLYLGYVLRCGPWTVYHSGDTVRYAGQLEWLKPFEVDVALLPINGRAPERRVAGNLNGPEAAELAWEAGVQCVIPCHYEMFEFNTASPDEFEQACRRLGQRWCRLRAGGRWSSASLSDAGCRR